ncbi:MAG: hypothetical protein O3B70_02985 [Bacteroidetes bacterium]|nr:hypothetical protein [Bacteroidota bacterium]MDA0903275.1 hypothetical protein [Bacteroidota bacterium]MDA1242166.1 hypothetical protein [Bacteroidota bacterium]
MCCAAWTLSVTSALASSLRVDPPFGIEATSEGDATSEGIETVIGVPLLRKPQSSKDSSTPCHQSADRDRLLLRSWYRQASQAQSTDEATRMSEQINQLESNDCQEWLLQGFRAVAELMIANHAWNPAEKLSRFLEWQPILEAAIQDHPEDPDLAFLRLGVQTHVPAFLSYCANIPADRDKVERALRDGFWSHDTTHEAFVREFLSYLKSL